MRQTRPVRAHTPTAKVRGRALHRRALLAALLAAAGCTAPERLDRQVHEALTETATTLPGLTTNTLADAVGRREPAPAAEPELALDLDAALRLATRHSRDLQGQREQLYLSGLNLLSQDRAFGVELASTVSYVFEAGSDTDEQTSYNADLSAKRKLPTGANLSISASTGLDTTTDPDAEESDSHSSSVGVRLDQPLLAGAGYESTHDSLIQARRSLLYALRGFALQRQDFALGILQRFQALLTRQTVLRNIEGNVEQSVFLRRRSEALFKVNRAPAIDVLRAQQQELRAKNQLAVAQSDFEIDTARFLIELGLRPDTHIAIKGRVPSMTPVPFEQDACIRLALRNRLDLATARDRHEDRKRAVRIARRGMLPHLDAFGRLTLSGEDTPNFSEQSLDSDSYSAGLTLQVPLDRRDERDALRKANINLNASARALEQKQYTVRIEVRESFSRLKALANTVRIESRTMQIAERRARNAIQRFKIGELSNRDVVEAENELLDARNAHARALAEYELQRLRLLKNIGLLDITPDGTFLEPPAAAKAAAGE